MRYKKYLEYSRNTYYIKSKKGIIIEEKEVDNYYGIKTMNDSGEYIEDKKVKVFCFTIPLRYKTIEDIYMTFDKKLSTGFKLDKLESHYKLKIYDSEYAINQMFYILEKHKIIKIKKIISKPKWKHTNALFDEIELFPYYINPKGIWQNTYDVVLGVIELGLKFLYRILKSIKNIYKKGEMKNV